MTHLGKRVCWQAAFGPRFRSPLTAEMGWISRNQDDSWRVLIQAAFAASLTMRNVAACIVRANASDKVVTLSGSRLSLATPQKSYLLLKAISGRTKYCVQKRQSAFLRQNFNAHLVDDYCETCL